MRYVSSFALLCHLTRPIQAALTVPRRKNQCQAARITIENFTSIKTRAETESSMVISYSLSLTVRLLPRLVVDLILMQQAMVDAW